VTGGTTRPAASPHWLFEDEDELLPLWPLPDKPLLWRPPGRAAAAQAAAARRAATQAAAGRAAAWGTARFKAEAAAAATHRARRATAHAGARRAPLAEFIGEFL